MIDKELSHIEISEWGKGIFDDLPVSGFRRPTTSCSCEAYPDHVIAVDADRVGAGVGSGQLKFFEGFGFGIKSTNLAADPLGEPDVAVGVELQTLRLPFGRGVELR